MKENQNNLKLIVYSVFTVILIYTYFNVQTVNNLVTDPLPPAIEEQLELEHLGLED